MHLYTVGGPYVEGRTNWPEGPHLWLEQDAMVLCLFLTNPDPREVEAISTGETRFAWVERNYSGYLLFKLGDMYWADASFDPHRLTEPFDLKEVERGYHKPLHIFLVHADTGIIAAMRMVTWPAHFVNTVVKSVNRIAARPYDSDAAWLEHEDLYLTYPHGSTFPVLIKREALATCRGGQREDVRLKEGD